jgi:diamine N-acetyltransferase
MTIVRCDETHLPTLLPVAKQSFIDAFEKDSNPENFKIYVEKAFTESAMLEELQHPESIFYAFNTENTENTVDEGNPEAIGKGPLMAGYVKLRWDRSEEFFPNEKAIELQRIYLLAQFWNKGYGKILLDFSENYACEHSFEWIYLVVWLENHAAIRFYERNGWEKFARKDFMFGEEVHHDWVLRKRL